MKYLQAWDYIEIDLQKKKKRESEWQKRHVDQPAGPFWFSFCNFSILVLILSYFGISFY